MTPRDIDVARLMIVAGLSVDEARAILDPRTSCAQCKAQIPPGRAGRRCAKCRDPLGLARLTQED